MIKAPEQLIYESAYRANILPLTSVCNVKCIFCSHSQNPQGIQIYRIPHRTLPQIEDTLQFINPDRKIVIGESVTRIIEGEPLTHPEIKKVLAMIRKRFPETTIQLTTNGSLIDEGLARYMADIGGVEVNLSINSADPCMRKLLMKDRNPEAGVHSAELLGSVGISYHGSIVAMPHITGWGDLGKTMVYLSEHGARTIRVFLPGFSRLASEELVFDDQMWKRLVDYVDSLRDAVDAPITIEPPIIRDLKPSVRGVIKDSPAFMAGVMKDDVILSVDGQSCFSRVDAFHRVFCGSDIKLELLRQGERLFVTLDKRAGETSGLVMDYDIDPLLIKDIENAARRYNSVDLLCSELAAPILNLALRESTQSEKFRILPVKSRFFGGSIVAAGLLVVLDFISELKDQDTDLQQTIPYKSDVLFLPSISFDSFGVDLTGRSYLDIQEATGQRVQII